MERKTCIPLKPPPSDVLAITLGSNTQRASGADPIEPPTGILDSMTYYGSACNLVVVKRFFFDIAESTSRWGGRCSTQGFMDSVRLFLSLFSKLFAKVSCPCLPMDFPTCSATFYAEWSIGSSQDTPPQTSRVAFYCDERGREGLLGNDQQGLPRAGVNRRRDGAVVVPSAGATGRLGTRPGDLTHQIARNIMTMAHEMAHSVGHIGGGFPGAPAQITDGGLGNYPASGGRNDSAHARSIDDMMTPMQQNNGLKTLGLTPLASCHILGSIGICHGSNCCDGGDFLGRKDDTVISFGGTTYPPRTASPGGTTPGGAAPGVGSPPGSPPGGVTRGGSRPLIPITWTRRPGRPTGYDGGGRPHPDPPGPFGGGWYLVDDRWVWIDFTASR